MAKHKYWTNYEKLYPSVEITPEVLSVLRKSDRKMAYMEHELKVGRKVHGDDDELLPAREESFEFLVENGRVFQDAHTPEDKMIMIAENQELQRCLESLEDEEKSLLHALFFRGLTEREYAQEIGLSQKAVNKRKHKVIAKIKKLWEIL